MKTTKTTTVVTRATTVRRRAPDVPPAGMKLVKRVRTITVRTRVPISGGTKTVRATEVQTALPATTVRTPSGAIVRVPAKVVRVRTVRTVRPT